MNRISRRPTAEAVEDLLEAGRTESALSYDIELGLARHHHWLRSDAPMPEWAGSSAGTAALGPVAIKVVVSALLMGALGVATWYARERPQPSMANLQASSPGVEPGVQQSRAVAPDAPDVVASERSTGPKPSQAPVAAQDLPGDQPVQRIVRADMPEEHPTRLPEAQQGPASARATSELEIPRASTADVAPARVEPAPATAEPGEGVSVERTNHRHVAPAHEAEREPTPATRTARPEPRPQAKPPNDLAEMQLVATAEQLLERSPDRALALVRQGDQRFARGYFQQERAYIAIMALIRLGRIDEARTRAASFAKQYPTLPYGARIRSALEAQQAETR